MLDEFIAANRAEIIRRCRTKAKLDAGSAPSNAAGEPERGIPLFLDQLVVELRNGQSAGTDITVTARQHGDDLLAQGYTVGEVVHDYGNVCQAVTELAVERNAVISTDDFRTLNRCLDDAIASAVTEYGRQRESADGIDDAADGVRRARVGRDLLKAIQIAQVAFEAIRSGKVGAAGSTGTVLGLGLVTAHDLTTRVLADIDAPPLAQPQ